MRTPELLCGVMVLTAAMTGCQRAPEQVDAKKAAADVASDIKDGTRKVAAKAGDELSDAWITTKIQSKFVADHDINASDIHVSSKDGVVTLSGLILNDPMRGLAVAVAKNTDGVHQVVDQLSVQVAAPVAAGAVPVATSGVAADAGPSSSSDDGRITASIQAKYYLDDTLKGRHIRVDTSNGVVTLRGDVGNPAERDEALLLARTSQGVKRVEDSLNILEP